MYQRNMLVYKHSWMVIVSGFFGERIFEMAKRPGAQIVRLEKSWGEAASDDEAVDFIRRERPQVVAFVQAETSTGVFQQSKALCDAAHEVDAVVIADCVTSLGAMPVDVDANGIDMPYPTRKVLLHDQTRGSGRARQPALVP